MTPYPSEQQPLFDLDEGRRLRDAGMEQVQHAPDAEVVRREVKRALWRVIQRKDFLTSDDVWEALGDVTFREPRIIGAVMRAAASAGFIEKNGQWVQSERPSAHARSIAVWRVVKR